MRVLKSIQELGDGGKRYKVRYESENCPSAMSFEGRTHMSNMLMALATNPDLLYCHEGVLAEKLQMRFDESISKWVIDLYADKLSEDD